MIDYSALLAPSAPEGLTFFVVLLQDPQPPSTFLLLLALINKVLSSSKLSRELISFSHLDVHILLHFDLLFSHVSESQRFRILTKSPSALSVEDIL